MTKEKVPMSTAVPELSHQQPPSLSPKRLEGEGKSRSCVKLSFPSTSQVSEVGWWIRLP